MACFYDDTKMICDFRDARSAPVIYGLQGSVLSESEKDFFRTARPFGFILFARNCETPQQLIQLTASLRECTGWHCPVLIDQEGGRVMRLKPPHWTALPSSWDVATKGTADADAGADADGVRLQARILAAQLLSLGIDVDTMPVADVYEDGVTDNCIGDRAYGSDSVAVARLCADFIAESYKKGLTPVIKHMPGHGQARVDSHKSLPEVILASEALLQKDFYPFKFVTDNIGGKGLWGMVAHIIYTQIDADLPASLSPKIIQDVIRKQLGYEEALLLSDDINMGALDAFGDVGTRCRMSLEAGMDIALHCSGNLHEMVKVAQALPSMSEKAQQRVEYAFSRRAVEFQALPTGDIDEMLARLQSVMVS